MAISKSVKQTVPVDVIIKARDKFEKKIIEEINHKDNKGDESIKTMGQWVLEELHEIFDLEDY